MNEREREVAESSCDTPGCAACAHYIRTGEAAYRPVSHDDCTEDGPDPYVCAGCDHQRAFHHPEHDGICLGHCDCTEFEEPA